MFLTWLVSFSSSSLPLFHVIRRQSLRKFEVQGGLIPGTEDSRGKITLDRPNRQWDYPFAWPPHQMLAWVGLERYGYLDEARRLAYRWCYMMTVAFVDFNGVVPEKWVVFRWSSGGEAKSKVDFGWVWLLPTLPSHPLFRFDAVKLSHMVEAEYGNQGIDFKFVPREGFGWVLVVFRRCFSVCVSTSLS